MPCNAACGAPRRSWRGGWNVSTGTCNRAEALSADFAEQATQTSNDEVLAAIGATVRAEITDIDAALGRLAAGRYGICARCGTQIEPARLRAVPYTLTCAGCAA